MTQSIPVAIAFCLRLFAISAAFALPSSVFFFFSLIKLNRSLAIDGTFFKHLIISKKPVVVDAALTVDSAGVITAGVDSFKETKAKNELFP